MTGVEQGKFIWLAPFIRHKKGIKTRYKKTQVHIDRIYRTAWGKHMSQLTVRLSFAVCTNCFPVQWGIINDISGALTLRFSIYSKVV